MLTWIKKWFQKSEWDIEVVDLQGRQIRPIVIAMVLGFGHPVDRWAMTRLLDKIKGQRV